MYKFIEICVHKLVHMYICCTIIVITKLLFNPLGSYTNNKASIIHFSKSKSNLYTVNRSK